MDSYPKISIVTVSYNSARYIEDNIKSLLDQNYPKFEHIIIDAGSKDGTVDILNKYPHLIWISEPDKGQSEGLNKGFKKSSGDIIGWINSDDCLAENSLYRVAEFFVRNPDEIAVVGDQIIIDEFGNEIDIVRSQPYTFEYLLNKSKGITQNSIFFRSLVFKKIGYLDENLHYSMDYDFFIRVASIKMIPYMPVPLAKFRIHAGSKTYRGTYYFSKERIKIRQKYKGRIFDIAGRTDLYILVTEPLRRISLIRKLVRKVKKLIRI